MRQYPHIYRLLSAGLIGCLLVLAGQIQESFGHSQSATSSADSPTLQLDHGDGYWAEKAQNYEPFVLDTPITRALPTEWSTIGRWEPVIQWPHIPVSAATLPDGRILTWASNQRNAFPVGPEFTYTATWDPLTGQFQEFDYAGHDMFCAHHVTLPDGRVLANGGRNAVTTTSVFDYRTNTWSPVDSMTYGRWYPTSIALPSGEVFTAGGGDTPTSGATTNPNTGSNTAELWTPGQGWEVLSGFNLTTITNTPGFESTWWPYVHLMPTGQILHSGPSTDMHVIDLSGQGSLVNVGPRISSNDWYPKDAAMIMYNEGKLLLIGGAASASASTSAGGASNRAVTIDMNGATPQVMETGSMTHARRFPNAVMLPTGEVMVIGGLTSGLKFSDSGSILQAELWNPTSQAWRPLDSMDVPRNYHSLALLLPDGRVLTGGGGLCGNCSANHQDAQLFTPHYLFNADGSLATRPVISQGPEIVGHGQVFSVSVTTSPTITAFNLLKMSSVTHAVTADQHFLTVPFTSLGNGAYQLTAHANSNVLTPGFYMLFAVDDQGVPSVAKTLQVVSSGQSHQLNVALAGTGEGTVVSTPVGIDCGNDCSHVYADSTSVALTATPAADSRFVAWSGACTGTTACSLIMTAGQGATATFENPPPTAMAGPDQTVQESMLVTLDSTGSTDFNAIPLASQVWTQTSGPIATLSSPTATQPSFTAPEVGESAAVLSFDLTVTDSRGLTDTDSVSITITPTPLFTLTVSKAGTGGGTVTSTTAGIDCGSNCSQSYPQGTTVTLNASSDPDSRFTGWGGDCTGNLTCTLNMTANRTVMSTFENPPPTANAGVDQTVDEGALTTLNASSSTDFNMAPLASYEWTQTSGPGVALSTPNSSQATFTATDIGQDGAILMFGLTVIDSRGLTASDSVTVTVLDANLPPLANAGPDQTVEENTLVRLDGSTSADADANGSIASFLWVQAAGPAVIFSDMTLAQPTFTAPAVVLSAELQTVNTVSHASLGRLAGAIESPADSIDHHWAFMFTQAREVVSVKGLSELRLDHPDDIYAVSLTYWDHQMLETPHDHRTQSTQSDQAWSYTLGNEDSDADLLASRETPAECSAFTGNVFVTNSMPPLTVRAAYDEMNVYFCVTAPVSADTSRAAPSLSLKIAALDCLMEACTVTTNNALFTPSLAFDLTVTDNEGLSATDRVVIQVVEADRSDTDTDNVINEVEDGAPNGGDGNNDGVLDRHQTHVASLPNQVDNSYVTVASPSGSVLKNVSSGSSPSANNQPANYQFPLGFLAFTVQGLALGESTTVTLFNAAGVTPDTYYKYGPTPDNPTAHWYEFLFNGTTGAEIQSDRIVLHFVDGQRGDEDLVANGNIVDPGGLATRAVIPPAPAPAPAPAGGGGGGGGGGGCTMTLGVRMDPTLLVVLGLILLYFKFDSMCAALNMARRDQEKKMR